MVEIKEAQPTQKFVEIEGVRDGTIVLKDGGLRQIVAVSGINFDLKSEEEQGMILNLFQSFLNSLDFAVQIFIHSRKVNIDKYLEKLEGREAQESNELLKNQIAEYREFIKAFVAQNAIMSKSYFVVVPYAPIKIPAGGGAVTKGFLGFLKKKGVEKPTERLGEEGRLPEEQLGHYIEQLKKRVGRVVANLNQMDLRAVPLNDEEITELFYNLYNPGEVEKKGMALSEHG